MGWGPGWPPQNPARSWDIRDGRDPGSQEPGSKHGRLRTGPSRRGAGSSGARAQVPRELGAVEAARAGAAARGRAEPASRGRELRPRRGTGRPGWGTAEARVRAGPARGAWAPGPCRQRGTLRCAPPESRARRGSAHAHPEGRLLERPELNLRPEANQRPGAPTRPRTWPGQERLLFSIFCFYGCVQIYVYCTSCFMTLTPCFYSLYEKGVSRGGSNEFFTMLRFKNTEVNIMMTGI